MALFFFDIIALHLFLIISFAKNLTKMTKSNRLIYLAIFLVATVLTVSMVFVADEWFWIPLPFAITYLAKALDVL